MYAGEIVETGLTKEVLAMPMHPYTQGLLASLPSAGLHPIPGMSPAPAHLPGRVQVLCTVPGSNGPVQHVCIPRLKTVRGSRQVRCFAL